METTIVVLQLLVIKPFQKRLWFYGSFCCLLHRDETSYDGRPMHSVKLIISEVSSEDYEQPFVCQASNAFGQVASYIILKHRGKKYWGFWGLRLSWLTQKAFWYQMVLHCVDRKEFAVCVHVLVHREGVTVVVYLSLIQKKIGRWKWKIWYSNLYDIFVKDQIWTNPTFKTQSYFFCSSWYTKMDDWRSCLFVNFNIYYFNNLQDFQDWVGALVP